jgi:3-oxo-5-alpha-steroid 4-dehydrogenase 3
MEQIKDIAFSISPAEWCQGFFVMATAVVLAVAVAPETARRHLSDYGARSSAKQPNNEGATPTEDDLEDDFITKFVIMITSRGQVPHSWFSGFYVTSLACSMFWLTQYCTGGRVLTFVTAKQAEKSSAAEAVGQVALVWGLMALQGARRLYEQLFLVKPSNSTIWIVHWLLGIFFYAFVSVSIWIEGSGKGNSRDSRSGI